MTRMSREFSLVLLGAGILTAGYFAAPSREDELEKKADEQAAKRVGHTDRTYHRSHGMFIFLHSPGYAGGSSARPASSPSVTRGGFGGGSGLSGGS